MYKIVRHFFDAPNVTIKRGLSLDEAQHHCRRDDTHGTTEDGQPWFDGFTEDDTWDDDDDILFDTDIEYETRGRIRSLG